MCDGWAKGDLSALWDKDATDCDVFCGLAGEEDAWKIINVSKTCEKLTERLEPTW